MKKILALILSALMLLSLASCGDDKTTQSSTDKETSAPATDSKDSDTTAPEQDAQPNSTVALETIAKALAAKYTEYGDFRSTYDEMMKDMPEEDKISFEEYLSYQIVTMPVEDLSFLSGLTEVPAGIGEAYLYQPGMMGQAYIGYLFRLTEGTDVETFKAALKEKADLRWNICTQANTIICENYGNTVFFSMMVVKSDEFPDGFTAEQKDGFIKTFMDTVSAK